jgi:hypothetical protein
MTEVTRCTIIGASWKCNIDQAIELLSSGADPNSTDGHGNTPLIYATRHGCIEIVSLLLEKGADTSIRESNRHRAYDYNHKMNVKNVIGRYPRSLYQKKDRSISYMNSLYYDTGIYTLHRCYTYVSLSDRESVCAERTKRHLRRPTLNQLMEGNISYTYQSKGVGWS